MSIEISLPQGWTLTSSGTVYPCQNESTVDDATLPTPVQLCSEFDAPSDGLDKRDQASHMRCFDPHYI